MERSPRLSIAFAHAVRNSISEVPGRMGTDIESMDSDAVHVSYSEKDFQGWGFHRWSEFKLTVLVISSINAHEQENTFTMSSLSKITLINFYSVAKNMFCCCLLVIAQ